ncbi:hypothetical protein WDV85_11645 [Pseudokineococcus sp. 5B2Z-1]|uniref:hypothetical protein n=1 Tax=Pseudokineococcus sp. 5B2Z-1 TaxID=3132744 RepID=UPI00309D2DE0
MTLPPQTLYCVRCADVAVRDASAPERDGDRPDQVHFEATGPGDVAEVRPGVWSVSRAAVLRDGHGLCLGCAAATAPPR